MLEQSDNLTVANPKTLGFGGLLNLQQNGNHDSPV